MTTETYLTAREVAERYKGSITVGTLANWRHKKQEPKFYKMRGRVLYKLSDLIEWEERQRK